jgi:hypothetical protein
MCSPENLVSPTTANIQLLSATTPAIETNSHHHNRMNFPAAFAIWFEIIRAI